MIGSYLMEIAQSNARKLPKSNAFENMLTATAITIYMCIVLKMLV